MAPIAAAFTTLFSSVGSAVGSGGTAGAGAGAAAGAGVAAGTGAAASAGLSIGSLGSTISSILAGTATLMSVSAAKDAAEIEATNQELAAKDALLQQSNETLQGIERRSSIKRAMMDAIGDQATSYAASGVDLSFGTPSVARQEAFREADIGLETSIGTERSRVARLEERASNLKTQAASTRRAAKVTGATAILQSAARYGMRG